MRENKSKSEGGTKKHRECETGDKNQDETSSLAMSNRDATQSGGEYLLLPPLKKP